MWNLFYNATWVNVLPKPKVTAICMALVKPILEYASTVWSPHTQRDIDAIENVQRWNEQQGLSIITTPSMFV